MIGGLLDTVTTFIDSPPGRFVAGCVLAGIVWKFFERVEAILTDQTKFEIAVWLVGARASRKVEPWPDTLAKLFDRVFGEKHLSWRCFLRSSLASSSVALLVFALTSRTEFTRSAGFTFIVPIMLLSNLVPDYLSLFKTRLLLRTSRDKSGKIQFLLVLFDLLLSFLCANLAYWIATWGIPKMLTFMMTSVGRRLALFWFRKTQDIRIVLFLLSLAIWSLNLLKLILTPYAVRFMWLYPAFFAPMWLVLYASSGFMLKAARRFDIGFQWFNRKVDIEKKPLSAIGLVAGAFVAAAYWAVAFGSYLLQK